MLLSRSSKPIVFAHHATLYVNLSRTHDRDSLGRLRERRTESQSNVQLQMACARLNSPLDCSENRYCICTLLCKSELSEFSFSMSITLSSSYCHHVWLRAVASPWLCGRQVAESQRGHALPIRAHSISTFAFGNKWPCIKLCYFAWHGRVCSY